MEQVVGGRGLDEGWKRAGGGGGWWWGREELKEGGEQDGRDYAGGISELGGKEGHRNEACTW